jgi:hypothetical protein
VGPDKSGDCRDRDFDHADTLGATVVDGAAQVVLAFDG